MFADLITRIVETSARRAWLTVGISALLTALAIAFAVTHFDMTTDTTALISPKVKWRQNEEVIARAFPQDSDLTVVVIDGRTPEIAEAAAARLTEALSARREVFARVNRPEGGPFFARQGLLLLSTAEVKATTDQLIAAQPFLGPLAADPSLRGVMTSISAVATGVESGQAKAFDVAKPVKALTAAVDGVLAGEPTFFSWQAMVGAGGGLSAPTRRIVLVQPKLDYRALSPGAEASAVIASTAKSLQLDAAHGARVRLTGAVPLSDEEFASLREGVWLVTSVMLLGVLSMLWLAVRSAKMVGAILGTTILGLVITAALGLAVVHRFNLISIAFVPLFVGLGVDFGIQLCVRFRADRLTEPNTVAALAKAARAIGVSLGLAAGAVTLGFLAFLPTSYIGVSELGAIAGIGMIVALALTLTLLPALLTLLRPPLQAMEVGWSALAPADRWLHRNRKLVLWTAAGSTLVSIALLPLLKFDFNALHLRNPKGEAMSTLLDLMRDPDRSPNTIDVLTPSTAAAEQLAARLGKLPEVAQAVTLASFVPEDQDAKLAIVQDASTLLDLTINPFGIAAPPSDAETVESLRTTAAALSRAALAAPAGQGGDLERLGSALDRLAKAKPEFRARTTEALIPPLNVLLAQVRDMLQPQRVTLETLPADLKRGWVTPTGEARVQAFPRGDSNDNATLTRFSKAVQAIAPSATGAPISLREAGRTISGAFLLAGVLSLIVISLLLLTVLKSLREVAFTLAPVVLSGFLTLASCVLIGQSINFANIIAFPLLFGVGVAFHIYFVMAWRGGQGDLLQSSLARAVLFSALTTGIAFGSLILSSHPGTASMGLILMISLAWTLVCALVFEPALLGPVETAEIDAKATGAAR